MQHPDVTYVWEEDKTDTFSLYNESTDEVVAQIKRVEFDMSFDHNNEEEAVQFVVMFPQMQSYPVMRNTSLEDEKKHIEDWIEKR